MRAKTQGVRKERLGLEVEPFDSFLSCPFVLNSPPIQRHKACIAVAMFVLTSHRDEIISSTNDPWHRSMLEQLVFRMYLTFN